MPGWGYLDEIQLDFVFAVPIGTKNVYQYLLSCTGIFLNYSILKNSGSFFIKLSSIQSDSILNHFFDIVDCP